MELGLRLTDEPARAFREASRAIGRPVLSLRCSTTPGNLVNLHQD